MQELRVVIGESAAAVLLLGGVIAGAQWLLSRIYGEHGEPAPYTETKGNPSCHQPR